MAGQVDRETSMDMLDSFASALCVRRHLTDGRAEIDTASMYQHRRTEQLLGDVLSKRADLRRSVFVATKANPFPGYGESLRPESVVQQLTQSLRDLGAESVDVLYLHAPDHATRIEATLEAVQDLYLEGKFRELGLSNFSAWETVHIFHLCKRRGFVAPSLYQGMYNAITRDVERELLPALRTLGIRFYAYNPLAGGLLSGKHREDRPPADGRFGTAAENGEKYRARYWTPEYFKALEKVRIACEAHGIGMAEASIRWVTQHSQLRGGQSDGVILGASSLEHLEQNLDAAAELAPLPQDVLQALDQGWETCKPSCPSYLR